PPYTLLCTSSAESPQLTSVEIRQFEAPMDDLQTLLSSYNLLKHFETIRSWVRPAIDVVPCSAESLSRFGGIADLPVGFKWPSHPDGVYHFLGQIDLASLPVTET